jgi:hypothetical protein
MRAQSSLMVTHPSTNRDRRRLTSVDELLSFIVLIATADLLTKREAFKLRRNFQSESLEVLRKYVGKIRKSLECGPTKDFSCGFFEQMCLLSAII